MNIPTDPDILANHFASEEHINAFDEGAWLIQIAFTGLDCAVTIEELAARAYAAKIDPKDFLKDMEKTTILVGTRGTNIANMKAKTSKAGAEEIAILVKRYSLVSNVKLMNESKSGKIAIGRVAACFPEIIAVNLALGLIKPTLQGDFALPLRFRFSGAPALMTSTEWATYKEAFLDYMVAASKVINQKNELGKETNDAIRARQVGFAMAILNSTFSTSHLKAKLTACNTMCVNKLKKRNTAFKNLADVSLFSMQKNWDGTGFDWKSAKGWAHLKLM